MMTRCNEENMIEKWEKASKFLKINDHTMGRYIDYSTYCINGGDHKVHKFHVFSMRNGFTITVPHDSIVKMYMNWDSDKATRIYTVVNETLWASMNFPNS